jgi:hypothetical protein
MPPSIIESLKKEFYAFEIAEAVTPASLANSAFDKTCMK